MNKIVITICLVALFVFILCTALYPTFGDFDKKISKYYLYHALRDTDAANVVSSIVWDYRAYDTLGEETVLFIAALGVYALFKKGVKK